MICYCSLAGTGACKRCPRYMEHFGKQEIEKIYNTSTQKETSYIPKIIEPKRGKWIKDRKFNTRMKTYVCSNCKHRVWGDREKTPYCPNCGSRMEGNEE